MSSSIPIDRHVASVSEEAKVAIETEEYVNSFTPSMMEATFAWSNDAKFSEVVHREVTSCDRLYLVTQLQNMHFGTSGTHK